MWSICEFDNRLGFFNNIATHIWTKFPLKEVKCQELSNNMLHIKSNLINIEFKLLKNRLCTLVQGTSEQLLPKR